MSTIKNSTLHAGQSFSPADLANGYLSGQSGDAAAKIPVLATTLSQDSIDYKDLSARSSLALVLGNEGQGISPEMAALADQLIHISMPGQAESLNVAVAAGILIFSLI